LQKGPWPVWEGEQGRGGRIPAAWVAGGEPEMGKIGKGGRGAPLGTCGVVRDGLRR